MSGASPGRTGSVEVCPCGEARDHVVARRSTSDGKHVLMWQDGSLTWALGYAIKGAPRGGSEFARRVGMLVLGEVCLYEAAEVPSLVAAARHVAQRSGLPGDVRRRYREITAPKMLIPSWQVYQTDRDGRPTVRVWHLPRLLYAGLVVWHESGVYEVLRRLPGSARETLVTTGFSFRTQRELLDGLPYIRSEVLSCTAEEE